MTTSLEKLHTTVAVQLDSTLSSYASVNLEKLHTTVAIQLDQTLSSYASVNLEKLYATVAIRGPTLAVAFASGTSGNTRALSDTLLYQKPTSDSVTGTWLNQAGAAVLYTSLSKPAGVDDATYIVASPITTDTAKVKLEAPVFEVGDEAYVDYRIGKNYPNAPQNVNVTVNLYQGATLIATWTNTAIAGNLTTITQTLTAPQLAAITDYSNLFLEFVSTPQ